ncbi:helix-turn-helix transcriptional regulator [Mycolicibacterium sp. 018/SC-01/001]|uniref:LuxR C-terminal-related transcriptional regulator n=1 Tax=Mycolicibacterium sp. 018/SC-01/001 TaxID=2592069 RepID=UPI00117D0594|nr:LuxR family transcriptional regulator [Mycolicibacterium sp. 018/SC-01/001]TRW84937.1 helix-turn-helix transcriptional regulator [Mycolicibacterium sp. 018/SC-01/001]
MRTTDCVGRDSELADLADRLRGTVTDGAASVAICAGPGAGKTALLRALTARHPEALWARGAAWESGMPFGIVEQLLQGATPGDPVQAATHLREGIGVGPALIVIDDAEYADIESVQALSTLLRHHRGIAVLVVMAVATSPPWLPELGADTVPLPGLAQHAIAQLVAARGRALHPAMLANLADHTAGNPGDVLALLDEVPDATWALPDAQLPAPRRVVTRTRELLSACGAGARAFIEALAVLGDRATLADAAALADLADPLPALDSALSAGLVVAPAPFEPRLADRLVRAAVIETMGVAGAAAAHRRAAEIVTDSADRLGHLVAATPTPDDALADEVAQHADEHAGEGAWAQAARLYRDAARLTADPLRHDERITRSVDALVAAGDCVAAAAHVPTVESLRETPLRNAVLAYLAILRGRAAEAEVRLARAADIVNPVREPDTAALVAQRHVLHALVRCRGEELVAWADRALDLADSDSPAGIESAAIRGLGLLAAGHPRRAAAAYDTLSARVRHGPQGQRVVMGRGWVQLVRDDMGGARASLESAVALAGLGGSRRITLWSLAWLARVQFATGEWDRAMDSVARGRELAAISGIVIATPLLEWTAAQIAGLRGDWAAAAQASRRASTVTADYEMMLIPAALARAQIAEAEADYAKVLQHTQALIAMAPGTSLQEPGYWPWPDLVANALVLAGRPEEADRFLVPHEQRARARGHRSAQARLGYARGRWHGALGDIHAATRSFDRSLDLLSGLPLRYDTARVNFAYGQTLRRAGKRRQADEVIGTAREIYLALGAHTYVARCDRELKAGGLHLQRGDGVELTPQEEAVTALVAQGLSNREVAAELFVSTKTVQYHLTRVYAKLGVRSRAELAASRR